MAQNIRAQRGRWAGGSRLVCLRRLYSQPVICYLQERAALGVSKTPDIKTSGSETEWLERQKGKPRNRPHIPKD